MATESYPVIFFRVIERSVHTTKLTILDDALKGFIAIHVNKRFHSDPLRIKKTGATTQRGAPKTLINSRQTINVIRKILDRPWRPSYGWRNRLRRYIPIHKPPDIDR